MVYMVEMMNSIRGLLCTVILLTFCLVAQAGVVIVGSLIHEKETGIGETYTGQIVASNNSDDKPQEVKLYQQDYFFEAEGKIFYNEPGTQIRSNAKWITYSPARFIIPPKENLIINYSIKVPNDPSLKGTYWSVLMVEGVPEESPESALSTTRQIQVGIIQLIRYSIQLVSHIGTTGNKQIQFISTKMLSEGGKQLLILNVKNTGQRFLRPNLWAEFYTEDGNFLGKYDGGNYRLYPDTSTSYKMDITGLPKNKYKALIIADCGGDDIFGVNLTLQLK
jgi:hypothetical protein